MSLYIYRSASCPDIIVRILGKWFKFIRDLERIEIGIETTFERIDQLKNMTTA